MSDAIGASDAPETKITNFSSEANFEDVPGNGLHEKVAYQSLIGNTDPSGVISGRVSGPTYHRLNEGRLELAEAGGWSYSFSFERTPGGYAVKFDNLVETIHIKAPPAN